MLRRHSILASMAGQAGGAAWVPPAGAIHWYYGDALRSGAWQDRISTLDAAMVNGAVVGADGLVCVNASQSYASLGAATGLASAGSMAAWARLSNSLAQGYVLYHRTGTTDNRIGSYCAGSLHRFSWGASATLPYSTAGANNVWRHLAMTWGADGSFRLYVDGVRVEAYSLEVLSDYGGTVTIGSTSITPASHTMNGNVDDVILATSQYSDEQIADIYAHSPGGHAT